jgi:PDZ domain
MRSFLFVPAVLLACVIGHGADDAKNVDPAAWERSVVQLDVTRKQYDYFQPWSKRMKSGQKTGIVISDNEILTTADELFDRTLIRLQKGGRGKWWIGELTWIDYYANLALVSTREEAFWRDLKPVALSSAMPAGAALQILHWREGKLENRKAEFSQFAVREGHLSSVNHVQLEVSSDIQGVGWGEPIIADSHVLGIMAAQDGRTCTSIPASFIQSILEARKKGQYRGLGYFDFYWQPAENPASLAFLDLEGEPRGVLVIDVPDKPNSPPPVLKQRDVILQIDGFDIDIEGDYNDPEFGHLMLENLATRRKWAGEEVKMRIWRDGKPLDVTYRLPKIEYTNSLLADAVYDQEPEYLIVGGLVFQPLTDAFLQGWGSDWKRRAPFRLYYYNNEPPTKDRPALVLLSQVLPDEYNIGYQDLKQLVVDKVNGQRVSRLPELRDALQKPINGFHVIQFVQSDSLRKMVVAAGDKEKNATQRVLQNYRIPQEFFFAPAATNAPVALNR